MIKDQLRNLSLDGLFVFIRAVKHMNFTHAATEAGVTQAAVSRRIQGLEQHLGKPLFIRENNRNLKLTRDGEKLYQVATTSLSRLDAVIKEIKRSVDENTVTVTSTAGFANLWLLHRLTDFNNAHPGVNIRLILDDAFLDLEAEGIDIGIRYGAGPWEELEVELLFPEYVYPVCSPAFLKKNPGISIIENLATSSLLHLEEKILTDINWSKWFQKFNMHLDNPKRKLSYNNYSLLIQSCLDGHGVCIGWHHIIYDLVESKKLVRPVEEVLNTEMGTYLVKPRSSPLQPNARYFVDWIRKNAKPQPHPGCF